VNRIHRDGRLVSIGGGTDEVMLEVMLGIMAKIARIAKRRLAEEQHWPWEHRGIFCCVGKHLAQKLKEVSQEG
jgi:hypothetical protein